MPQISVILPVYNIKREYLTKAVESVLAQSFADFELLIVDDGSKKETADVCDELAAKDKRVTVFHNFNQGPGKSRNFGLTQAQGEFVIFMDHDDWVEKDWLKKLYYSYAAHPEDIQVHRAHRVKFIRGGLAPYEEWEKHVKDETARYDNFLTGVGGVLYPPECFIKEVLREDVFLKQSPNADDVWLWVMALLSNRKIRVVKNHIETLRCTNLYRQMFKKGKTLYVSNSAGGNDEQLHNLMKLYGQNILGKLKQYR